MFISALTSYTVTNSSKEDFHHYTINFNAADFTFPEVGKIAVLETKSGSSYARLFEQASFHWHEKKQNYKIICKSYLYEILYNFFNECINKNIDSNDFDRILPAKNYIDTSYMICISSRELAEMCGLSETSLRRIFKKIYNMSPVSYQMKIRIEKAKDLLSCKLYSVKEVAFKTGFGDPYYFSKFFKKYTGLSPENYKKLY